MCEVVAAWLISRVARVWWASIHLLIKRGLLCWQAGLEWAKALSRTSGLGLRRCADSAGHRGWPCRLPLGQGPRAPSNPKRPFRRAPQWFPQWAVGASSGPNRLVEGALLLSGWRHGQQRLQALIGGPGNAIIKYLEGVGLALAGGVGHAALGIGNELGWINLAQQGKNPLLRAGQLVVEAGGQIAQGVAVVWPCSKLLG